MTEKRTVKDRSPFKQSSPRKGMNKKKTKDREEEDPGGMIANQGKPTKEGKNANDENIGTETTQKPTEVSPETSKTGLTTLTETDDKEGNNDDIEQEENSFKELSEHSSDLSEEEIEFYSAGKGQINDEEDEEPSGLSKEEEVRLLLNTSTLDRHDQYEHIHDDNSFSDLLPNKLDDKLEKCNEDEDSNNEDEISEATEAIRARLLHNKAKQQNDQSMDEALQTTDNTDNDQEGGFTKVIKHRGRGRPKKNTNLATPTKMTNRQALLAKKKVAEMEALAKGETTQAGKAKAKISEKIAKARASHRTNQKKNNEQIIDHGKQKSQNNQNHMDNQNQNTNTTKNQNAKVTTPDKTTQATETSTPSTTSPTNTTTNTTSPTDTTTDMVTEESNSNSIDLTRSVRFGFNLTLKASDEPLPAFAKEIKQFLQFIQEQVHANIYMAIWDSSDTDSEVTEWKAPKEIPKGVISDRLKFFNFFDKYVNPKKNKEEQIFLKIRFTTDTPNDLPFPLTDLGKEISDTLEDKYGIKLYKNPQACQAAKVTTLGWLWGSTKSMSEKTLLPEIKKEMKIPSHVAIGLQWRTIKSDNGRNYKWSEDKKPPPQALHLDIDENYAALYAGKAAKIWKKSAKIQLLSLHLRLVPCFGGFQMTAMDDRQRENTLLMAQKQHYFISQHITQLTTSHIQSLDAPIQALDQMTLRRYLMGRAPKDLVTQRLFVTVDKSWKPGNEYILVTSRSYSDQATRVLNNMIPECLAKYGTQASIWFTNTGLQVFKDVQWDTVTGKSTSHQADETEKMVNEADAFGMGDTWKKQTSPGQKPTTPETQRPQVNETTTSTDATNNDTQAKVSDLLAQRAQANDIQSFGSILGREKDDDTIATTKTTANAPLKQHTVVEFTVSNIETTGKDNTSGEDYSMGMSTAGKTTGTTRLRCKELELLNGQLQNEVAALTAEKEDDRSVKTTVSTAVKLSSAIDENEQLKAQIAALLANQNNQQQPLQNQELQKPKAPDKTQHTQKTSGFTYQDVLLKNKENQEILSDTMGPAPTQAAVTDTQVGGIGPHK